MLIKIITLIVAVICGVASLLAKKVLYAIKKNEPTEQQLLIFKAIIFIIIACAALVVILPDIL